MLNYLWLVLGILLGFIVLFFLVDLFLKSGDKKETPKAKSETPKPAAVKTPQPETEIKPVTDTVTPPKIAQIYNSNLADELDEILKQNSQEDQTRIEIGKHIHKQSNISQYLKTKNYQTFDFQESEVNPDKAASDDNKMTFTKEDYKRIVALSNIDTKK